MDVMTSPKTVSARTPDEDIPPYYDRPALKPSLYGWTVGLYMFVGGLAAGTANPGDSALNRWRIPGSGPDCIPGPRHRCHGRGGWRHTADRRFAHQATLLQHAANFSPDVADVDRHLCADELRLLEPCGAGAAVAGLCPATTICGILASVAGLVHDHLYCVASGGDQHAAVGGRAKLLAVRFASSAMATGGATVCVLVLATGSVPSLIHIFGLFTALALLVELIAALAASPAYRTKGVHGPLSEPRSFC